MGRAVPGAAWCPGDHAFIPFLLPNIVLGPSLLGSTREKLARQPQGWRVAARCAQPGGGTSDSPHFSGVGGTSPQQ